MNKPFLKLPPSFFQEEVRHDYTIPASMKKIWAVQLELLSVLLDVCQKNNLKIWADGGTLLGTIREHGYIPWDDDIDMAMLRPDYDKLIVIANKVFKSPYFFQCGYTEDKYPRGHAQLRKDGTAAILPGDICQSFHQGIFIDIFVYDSVPNEQKDVDELQNNTQYYLQQMRYYCYKPYSIYNLKLNYQLFKLKREINRIGFKNVFSKFDNYFRRYTFNDCDNVACMGFVFDFDHFLRNKHFYEDTLYMPFETIMMPVPIGYDKILTIQYGDYMKPVKAPAMHGGFTVLDTEKSYIDYLPQLRRHFYKEAWKKRFLHIIRFFHK